MLSFSTLALLASFLPAFAFAQEEVCNNGIDDDCNGLIDLNDPDGTCYIVTPDDEKAETFTGHVTLVR